MFALSKSNGKEFLSFRKFFSVDAYAHAKDHLLPGVEDFSDEVSAPMTAFCLFAVSGILAPVLCRNIFIQFFTSVSKM